MEKKSLRKRDVLRMDGLLPPTRRLPVCDAVTSTSDKKKDKKWSIGGILRRISSIRDYDSSSNDEEIVYKKLPKKSIKFVRQSDDVVLHSLENNSEHDKRARVENNVRHSADSPHLYRDSLHSRSSDGSLDGLGKKYRRNKLKARAEAKRDHLCVDSSSDEDCRRSNGSLNRFHGAETGQRSNNACNNRKTRAARTERYIKRLSRDDINGSSDTLANDLQHKKCLTESHIEDKERVADNGGLCRPPVHPRRFAGSSNDRTVFPTQISSVENLRDVNRTGLPNSETIYGDFRRYSTGIQYVTDLNQNNTYGKISRSPGKTACADNYGFGNFFTYPAKHSWHHSEPCADYITDRRPIDATNNRPPEPPPRDPRYRAFNYGYSSYPARKQQYNAPNSFKQNDEIANGMSILDGVSFRSNYGSNNETVWRNGATERRPNSTSSKTTDFRNSLERINNQYNSTRHGANNAEKIDNAARCRHRNTRNNQLNCGNDENYSAYKNKSTNVCKPNKQCEMTILSHAASSDWSSRRSPCEQRVSRSVTPTSTRVDNRNERSKQEDARRATPTSEEAMERRRSSRNLEEALSELEAIYNSLRLGDEDLLDRAERRSMEEFSLKHSKNELDAAIVPDDSPDRTTDDMAYRRMHPKERPTSLSDIAGQSALSNISYLIASPILSRRDSADDLARLCSSATYPSYRRNEPDVTRDDVVFRSITHANNTLRVIDPQPPFGIPLGPVTAATESDYLHTTPTKPEQPRSPYIPQCEPDVITDDLAYRTLRKDAGAARSPTENRIVAKEQTADVTRKKRAVRSLSANLYGLINHDRIHLRREPSLDAIRDEIQNAGTSFAAATSCERPEYLRRVVSDGELSDTDARRRKKPSLVDGRDTDINGNHPMVGAGRDKPCAYTLLETTTLEATRSPKKASSAAELSDVAMMSSRTVLDDDFWHEYLRSDSNISAANSGTTETDFSAYSRLCQDLVNLIKSDEDTAPPIESPNADDSVAPTDKSNDVEHSAVDEPATSPRSLDSHCSESQRAARASDERRVADENADESPIPSSIANSAEPASESNQPADNLDFYLRVADENVKLIAEAFGDVVDRLRDNRLSALKNNSSPHGSEAESYSARSSALQSQDEQATRNDEQRRLVLSPRQHGEIAREKRNSTTSNEEDQSSGNRYEDVSTADAELDLSRAVRNLQLAAASLCEHGPEIESLRIKRAGRIDVTPVTSTDENEDSNPMRKIGLIADALRQEQERDQEEKKTAVRPSGVETTRSDATRCDENREGYQTLARSQ
ncbi:uncharacterized protein LOC109857368 isoform X2 [Pseudomyrmex gracilis]|uniref:uncharacterized protein LOC109857368 isoform X2 n=1 Tax=Pseudomyrmex gracilis TaxID=219809 RepID=UPI0009952899|nr:uncharacterized protein LOC109857368 isoform X2 [Pseudomyrmex gracilis]